MVVGIIEDDALLRSALMATAGCFSSCRFIDMIKITEVTTMETKNIILKFRTGRGMSQDELADKIMVTRQAVSRWENGV